MGYYLYKRNGSEKTLWPITRNRYESTYYPFFTILDDDSLI